MARQFKRVYELTIIPPSGESRVITNLRINFEITKSVLSYPNLAKIAIYNPNQETVSALQSKFTKLILNAGYEGNIGLIFKGDVRNSFPIKKGVDRIITVYAGDGEKSWQNATFNKTFSDTVTVNAVVNDVLSSFEGITTGIIEGISGTADKLLGQTLSGSSKDIMDTLSDEYNFNWSMQDEQINIAPVDAPLKVTEAVVINSKTGMIGSPTITEIGADVTTLLNPQLRPEFAFQIESLGGDAQLGNLFFRDVKKTTAEGLYKVMAVVFKGDSREGEWTSTVKGKSYNG